MINGLSNAVTASILTRLLANIFAFAVLMAALTITVYQIVTNQQVNSVCWTVLGAGIGYTLHMLGLNQGVTLSPLKEVIDVNSSPK